MNPNNKFPSFGFPECSPMTEISINLSGASINDLSGKRRLNLSEENELLTEDDFKDIVSKTCLEDITNTNHLHLKHLNRPKSRQLTMNTSIKENIIDSPTKHDQEVSLYGGFSPTTLSPSCSPEIIRTRNNIDDSKHVLAKSSLYKSYQSSSIDSGIGSSFCDDYKNTQSSCYRNETINSESKGRRKSLFSGLSGISNNDDFVDLLQLDYLEESSELPKNFHNLVSGDILVDIKSCSKTKIVIETAVKDNEENSENINDANWATPIMRKRGKSHLDSADMCEIKKLKPSFNNEERVIRTPKRKIQSPLCKAHLGSPDWRTVCSPNTIMCAVQRSAVEPDLIGDFSKPFVLPLVSGRHQDLKSITPNTLAKLLRGEYRETVSTFRIIDCRYPYEYEGGHITGALNYFTKEQIESELFDEDILTSVKNTSVKRNVIIFHCEFSAQRGPKLFRCLREMDRTRNNSSYPALYYPEIYLLEGGYKRFFEEFNDLCVPKTYLPMNDPAYETECRQYRLERKASTTCPKNRKLPAKRSALEF